MQCSFIKGDGGRCKRFATDSSGLCSAHSPHRAEARSRAASKAGKRGGNGRPGLPELRAVRREVREVIEAIESRTLDESRGRAIFQGYRVLLQAVELERKVQEQDDLLVRLEAIEQRQAGRGGPRRTS